MAGPQPSSKARLSANYGSSSAEKAFTHSIPTLPNPHSTEEKTAYLSALRSAVTKLQEEVNSFLTQKMEEDKDAGTGSLGKVDEKREEENYGEEGLEE
ncbi:MAG: hypothetical protein M1812_004959 [Candelaria pacifica]|nr:MAG: hypothetical protein M1812_004959 [Candelaria pacifica]